MQDVEVIPEGVGAYQLAKHRGYIPRRGYTVVIDLGGSTWIDALFDEEGELLYHHAHERAGAYLLASQIANDDRLRQPVNQRFRQTAPSIPMIMDGFCQNHYYGNSEIQWGGWFQEYLDPWWRNMLNGVKSTYQEQLPYIRRIVITGGMAHLVVHKVSRIPMFVVMPEPGLANVVGGYHRLSQPIAA